MKLRGERERIDTSLSDYASGEVRALARNVYVEGITAAGAAEISRSHLPGNAPADPAHLL